MYNRFIIQMEAIYKLTIVGVDLDFVLIVYQSLFDNAFPLIDYL